MENTTHTDNFLQAIKRYAEEQQRFVEMEAEQLRTEKLKDAEAKGKHDSEKYIKDMLELKRNEETSKLATLVADGRKKLFMQRAEMTNEIFKMAENKLIKYSETKEYNAKLLESAQNIATLFGGNSCVIYINEKDLVSADKIKAIFNGKAEILADNKSVKLGGIKAFCKEMSIVADETLDSKLEAQREWFTENSSLSVL